MPGNCHAVSRLDLGKTNGRSPFSWPKFIAINNTHKVEFTQAITYLDYIGRHKYFSTFPKI